MIAPDTAAHRFLVAQQRQESYHAKIFQQVILWLTPRGSESCPALPPLTRYRSPAARVIDGALFALVLGTDPELLLMIELYRYVVSFVPAIRSLSVFATSSLETPARLAA